MTTRPQTRAALYDAIPGLGFTIVLASSYGSGDIKSSDQKLLANADGATTRRYRDLHIYRPNRAAGDQHRIAGDLGISTAVATLAHNGPAWSNTSDTVGELIRLHPDEFNGVIERAADRLLHPNFVPLAHGPADSDLQGSGVTDWDDNDANVTIQKQTTAAEVLRGARSLDVTLSGAGGSFYADAATDIGNNRGGFGWCLARLSTGTGGVFSLLDGSAALLSPPGALSFAERRWVLLRRHFPGAEGVRQWRPRFAGVDNGDQLDVQFIWLVNEGEKTFRNIPSWLDKRFRVSGVRQAHLTQIDTDIFLWDSVEWEDLKKDRDFKFHQYLGDANPYAVEIMDRGRLAQPLFLTVDSPYSAPYGQDKALDDESTDCPVPLDLLVAQTMIEMAKDYNEVTGSDAGIPIHDGEPFPGLHSRGAAEKHRLLKGLYDLPTEPLFTGWGNVFR